MPIKILAAGDLHLGKRSSGVPDDARTSSSKYTWELMINMCIDKQVDVLVLPGDIIDKDNRFFEAIGPLLNGFTRLKEHGVQVLMTSGNHDYDVPRQVADTAGMDHVALLGQHGQWEVRKLTKEGLTVQFAGWSFPEEQVKKNPLEDFDRAAIDPAWPAIGILHCDVDVRDSVYAPVIKADLMNTPVNAWLLGHIHKPEEIHHADPLIWYTGSPQAFSAKEPGTHGPLLVTVDDNQHITAHHISLSPIRYEPIQVSVNGEMDEGDLRSLLINTMKEDAAKRKEESAQLQYILYDVTLIGEHERILEVDKWMMKFSGLPFQELPGSSMQYGIRKIISEVRPLITNLEEYVNPDTPVGVLAETILAIREDRSTPLLDKLIRQWQKRYNDMKSAPVYMPLQEFADEEYGQGDKDTLARSCILQECNRLFTELLSQQAP